MDFLQDPYAPSQTYLGFENQDTAAVFSALTDGDAVDEFTFLGWSHRDDNPAVLARTLTVLALELDVWQPQTNWLELAATARAWGILDSEQMRAGRR